MATDILPSEIPVFSGSSRISTDYSFAPETMSLTVSDADFKRVLYVVNSTHSVVMYNPYDKEKLGAETGDGIIFSFPVNGYMLSTDDMLIMYEGEPSPTVEIGGASKLDVIDVPVEGLLTQILKELKMMNWHLMLGSDDEINKTEID